MTANVAGLAPANMLDEHKLDLQIPKKHPSKSMDTEIQYKHYMSRWEGGVAIPERHDKNCRMQKYISTHIYNKESGN